MKLNSTEIRSFFYGTLLGDSYIHNNVFAYIDLYTINGIIESVAWSSIFKTYGDLLQKGKCIALLGRKGENNQMFIKEVKDFQVWLKARKEDLKENGGF